jgi:ACS family pantothenate transporter-like MFS transporter
MYFGIWLKSEHFSVVERNVIPSGGNLISAFCIVMVCDVDSYLEGG